MAGRHGPRRYDPNVPDVARMYDYGLGGHDNFPADREQWAKAVEGDPSLPMLVRENRAFVQRVTRFLAGEGMDQFLDLGSGLPTQENVHEIAEEVNPQARTVYVDYDPVVKAHSDAMLAEHPRAVIFQHDLRDVEGIVRLVARRLNLAHPVAVLCTATLHFIPDEDEPDAIMARLRDALAPGSCLALTHASGDGRPEQVARTVEIYKRTSAPGTPRTREQVLAFFGDFTLVEPGLVWVPAWRPDRPVSPEQAADAWFYAAVARKP